MAIITSTVEQHRFFSVHESNHDLAPDHPEFRDLFDKLGEQYISMLGFKQYIKNIACPSKI